jgi:ABC-type sugar transport system permease subunit
MGACLFFLFPIFVSIKLSFSEIVKLKGFVMEWVGLENYKQIFFYDINFIPMFIKVVKDTIINTPITLVFSLLIAILINRPVKGRSFFRTAFFIPVLLGSGYIMKQLLGMGADSMSITSGIMVPDSILSILGPTVSPIVQGFLNRITVILWKSGVQIILFLAGLQGIPSSLYEAAKCDGATEWEMFWKVTLPIISPVILLNFIFTMVAFFTDSNNAIVDYILEQSFANTQFALGAAMGWVYFSFTFVLCLLALAIMKKRVYNLGERS